MQLETERLLLREFVPDDWAALHEFESDPQIVRFMTFEARTPEQAKAYVNDRMRDRDENPRSTYDLVIATRGDDRLIGRCGLKVTDVPSRQAMLWYSLNPRQHGKGIAPEAARAIVTFGFAELRLHRIWADLDPRNAASTRVVEKLGMRREAHLRENVLVKGEMCDSFIYAVLAREWSSQ